MGSDKSKTIPSPTTDLIGNKPESDFVKHRLGIEEIEAYLLGEQNEGKSLFTLKSANKWMADANKRPIPKMLFGELWYEGEISILFADTNQGKSILAVQIADSISRGKAIAGFKFEAQKQKVLYFDFELSDKQFENRYSIEYEYHFQFDEDFIRVEIDPEANTPDEQTFEDYLHDSLERSILETDAKILIIDNLTYLKNETEKAKDALPLMKHLKALKSKYNLSLLVLAHTPKRDLSKPITRNDLQGSKMLINFCDSAFAIGECHTDKHLKYIKQIKARSTEIIYDSENVAVCQITKPFNFLQLEYVRSGNEREYIKQMSDKDNDELEKKILELRESGMSLRAIGVELHISHMRVDRILKKFDECNGS